MSKSEKSTSKKKSSSEKSSKKKKPAAKKEVVKVVVSSKKSSGKRAPVTDMAEALIAVIIRDLSEVKKGELKESKYRKMLKDMFAVMLDAKGIK